MRASIGAVVEIPVDGNLAYAQITHKHKKWGYLLRIFETRYSSRPAVPEIVVKDKIQFTTFYPVTTAANLGLVSLVGKALIPEENSSFPVFKCSFPGVSTQEFGKWWLWDGEREWRVDRLSSEQIQYPYRMIVTGDHLHKLVRDGWRDGSDRLAT